MDIGTIKIKALQIRSELKKKGVHADVVILFGSHARGQANTESDIDLAIVSRDFGKDRLNEGALVNFIASKIDSSIEIIPVSFDKYFDPNCILPIIHEIKTTGLVLF